MTLPLYQTKQPQSHPKKLENSGNAGLWFDKFVNTWHKSDKTGLLSLESWSRTEDIIEHGRSKKKTVTVNPKNDWLESTKAYSAEKHTLDRYRQRQAQLAEHHQAVHLCVESTSALVSGMGNNNPTENGMTWHHTLGLPYLPGSSLKGILRNWLSEWNKQDDKLIKLLFGSQPSGKDDSSNNDGNTIDSQLGGLVFLDALPSEKPTLGMDIMTPHYGDWYLKGHELKKDPYQNQGANRIPAGWHNPTPIPFLVVEKIKLDIYILPGSRLDQSKWQPLHTQLANEMASALQTIGAGAKTAVGYGRFKRDSEEEHKRQQEAEQQQKAAAEAEKLQAEQDAHWATLSAEEQQFETDIKANNPHGNPLLAVAIGLLKSGFWQDNTQEMAAIIAKRMQASTDNNTRWRPASSKKNPAKDKAHQNTLIVQSYLEKKP